MTLLRDVPTVSKRGRNLDSLLKDLALRCVGIAEIHHLVEQLIDDHEVIPDRFLFELFEVLGEDLVDQHGRAGDPTEHNRCRKKMISAAFEFRFDMASTDVSEGVEGERTI